MGILNVTPDSFSDGGEHDTPAAAVAHGLALAAHGADIVDIGGESTRPGHTPVAADAELARVMPVLRELRARLPETPLSVDTTKTAVALAALDAGADMVNDVSGAPDDTLCAALARTGALYVLTHAEAPPPDLPLDALAQWVADGLGRGVASLEERGVARSQIWLDPGFGFGKRGAAMNYRLLRDLPAIVALGLPVLVGASRKSFIGEATGEPDPARRDAASAEFARAAFALGARCARVHTLAH